MQSQPAAGWHSGCGPRLFPARSNALLGIKWFRPLSSRHPLVQRVEEIVQRHEIVVSHSGCERVVCGVFSRGVLFSPARVVDNHVRNVQPRNCLFVNAGNPVGASNSPNDSSSHIITARGPGKINSKSFGQPSRTREKCMRTIAVRVSLEEAVSRSAQRSNPASPRIRFRAAPCGERGGAQCRCHKTIRRNHPGSFLPACVK